METNSIRKRLLITSTPEPFESLRGFLLRLSDLNGYRTPSWITTHICHGSYNIRLSKSVLCRLSEFFAVEANTLDRFGYRVNHLTKRFGNPVYFGAQLIPRAYLKLDAPRVCPECLADAPYLSAIWDIELLSACPQHGKILLARCPQCDRRLTWRRRRVTSCDCEFDLRAASTPRVTNAVLEVNKLIAQAAGYETPSANFECGIPHAQLAKLSLHELLDVVSLFGRLCSWNRGQLQPRDVNTVKNWHPFTDHAAGCLEDWPNNFYLALGRVPSHSEAMDIFHFFIERACHIKTSHDRNRQKRLRFIRDAIDGYYHTRWRTDYESRDRATVKFIMRNDVKKLLKNVGSKFNARRIDEFFASHFVDFGRHQIQLYSRQRVQEFCAWRTSYVTVGHAAAMLGITRAQVLALREIGLLSTQRDPFSKWRFIVRAEEVENLVSTFRYQCCPQENADRNSLVSFRQASRRLNISISKLIEFAYDNPIPPIAFDFRAAGLQQLLFSVDELILRKTEILRATADPTAA